MPIDRRRNKLDVIGRDEIAALQGGKGFRGQQGVRRGPSAGPQGEVRRSTAGRSHLRNVGQDALLNNHLLDQGLYFGDSRAGQDHFLQGQVRGCNDASWENSQIPNRRRSKNVLQ